MKRHLKKILSVSVFLSLQLTSSISLAILKKDPVSPEDFGRGTLIDHVVGIESKVRGVSRDKNICTGVLLDAGVILTAAHCFNSTRADGSASKISFGSYLGSQTVQVQSIYIHPNYKSDRQSNDLAIVTFVSSISSNFKPISDMIQAGQKIENGIKLGISGYGQNYTGPAKRDRHNRITGRKDIDYLRIDQVPLDSQQQAPPSFIIDQHGGKGICTGDSGGPLFWLTSDGQHILIGIARSVGQTSEERIAGTVLECASFGIFTDLRPHLDWIQHAVAQAKANLDRR